MSLDNFNKDFTKAFTRNCILYSATEEYSYGNLLFMQFTGDAREMNSIAISVVNNMYQGKLISRIIRVLENKNLPQVNQLCSTANNLINEFNSYIQQEPYTSAHCNELIQTMRSFYELVNSLNHDLCEQVLNKLKDLSSCIYNADRHANVDSYYLYEAIEQIKFYLKNLLKYYYHFLIVKEQEHENCKGIGLTTQVADYLWELIGKIETVSDYIEDVLEMLLTWEIRMDMCEEQALYN
ncbi:hypothetical protein A4D02_24955 [Niastella koreensis]|uniref:Uncharacterized protein n=2 Tax=Niastella koreensis TaxID=354356 RepID=G8TFY1_NIAKG|nr:hypothetical protein [Niastella koreensis]AEW00580.1 hypothetical protein Niako_4317 [Niastella koreensis GR20-10]OQP52439.1 hypothetical protein A4D02_24955 [Niastella koreensis]